MGLDMTLYIGVTKSPAQGRDNDGEPLDLDSFQVYADPYFTGRETPLEDRQFYRYESCEDVYHSGYGTYSAFRDLIREALNLPETGNPPGLPFVDMLWFSDCDGCIGPDLCKRLADDFATHADKILPLMDGVHKTNYVSLRDALVANKDKDCALRFH